MAIDAQNLRGAFPVFDTSKSVGTYTANLARQSAQRQAEQKALQEDVDKIKIDGLRDADKADYFKGFEDWRTTAQQATKERDFRKKAELQSDSDKKFLELQALVAKSKEYNRTHQDVSMKFLDDKFRDQFTDDAVEKWRKSGQLPLSSKEIVLDPTALGRQVDLSGVNKVLTDVDEDLLKQAKYQNPVTRRITSGNKTGTESIYQRTVDPATQIKNYGMLYDTNRDVRNYFRQQFPEQFANMPEDQAKAFALTELVKQRPIQRQDAPKMEWDRAPDNFYAHYNYRLENPINPTTGVGVAQQMSIPFGKGDKKGTVQFDEYIPISISKKNFAGSEYIDLKTGKPAGKLSSSNDYEIVGVGNAPFIKASMGGNLSGAIAQPNFAEKNPQAIERKPVVHVQVPATSDAPAKDYFVPYDRLPENVKSSKQVRDALQGFKPATKVNKAPTEKKQETMVTMILPSGQSGQIPQSKVSDFLKKYPKAKKQ